MEQLGSAFNVFRMLVVDFMHEFELGVWKMLFIHLIRMLYAVPNRGAELVARLDERLVKYSLCRLYITLRTPPY